MGYEAVAGKLSQLTIDANLAMGEHDITLAAGRLVDGKDLTNIDEGVKQYVPLYNAFFTLNAGTAINGWSFPEKLTDGDTTAPSYGNAIGEGVEILFNSPVRIKQFNIYGNNNNAGTAGRWKIQGKKLSDAAWEDIKTGIVCSNVDAWCGWTNILEAKWEVPYIGVRFLITNVDGGGTSYVKELNMKY